MIKKIGKVLILLAYACGMHGQNFDEMVNNLIDKSVPLIQPEELDSNINTGKNILVLDAREKEEYDVSHLENAVWVGYDDFELENVSAGKDQEIVVYCSVGYRSEKVGEKLQKAGYTNVQNLYGGIFNWTNKEKKLVDNDNQKTQKVHAYSKSWGKWLEKGEKVYD